jgi:hypothetical protein
MVLAPIDKEEEVARTSDAARSVMDHNLPRFEYSATFRAQ